VRPFRDVCLAEPAGSVLRASWFFLQIPGIIREMKCPKCSSESLSVIDSRGDDNAIRRRRECQSCNFRFTTFERLELSMPLVVKKDGRREGFDRQKIKAGILRACEKRPVSVESIEKIVDTIEFRISEMFVKEMSSRQIGDFVMEALERVDKIAYVRFASVYREFSDISQFMETLQNLTGRKKPRSRAGTGRSRSRTVRTAEKLSGTAED